MALGGPNIYPGVPAFPVTTYTHYWNPAPVRPFLQELTPEQQEEQRRALEQLQKEQEEQRRKLQEADGKARKLLLSMLNPEQKRSFEKDQEFTVLGSKGTMYRIGCRSISGNVTVLTGIEKGTSLCAYPRNVPKHDIWLAQKLALESDEEAFRQKAYPGGFQFQLAPNNFNLW